MEATLFWIGCGLGVYGVVLRQIFQREAWIKRRRLPMLASPSLHGGRRRLDRVCVQRFDGPPRSDARNGPSPGACLGFLWGAVQLLWNRSKPEGGVRLLAEDLEWVETSFSAIILASVIMYAVLQAFKIPSGSMEDTLLIGDHLFVNKFIYGIRVPFTDKRVFKIRDVKRGEVVVFEAPPEAILSRDERERRRQEGFHQARGRPARRRDRNQE